MENFNVDEVIAGLDYFHIPFLILNRNGLIKYNSAAEGLFTKLLNAGVYDIAGFIYEKIHKKFNLVTVNQEKYLLKVSESSGRFYVVMLDMNNVFSEYSLFFDISSFLHEIKNPLTVIDGTVQLLRNKSNEDYSVKCSDIISKESKRLKDFVDDFGSILDIELNYEEFYILEFFEEMFDSLKVLFKNVSFTTEIASDFKSLSGDKDFLYRAFYNIIKNSCEAKPDGEIKIVYTLDSTIKYRDTQKNRLSSMSKFTIIDNAGGIPADVKDKIFTPFFTTKSKGKGLGLVIAKEIIEKHRGILSFNTNNYGTIFTVLLPL